MTILFFDGASLAAVETESALARARQDRGVWMSGTDDRVWVGLKACGCCVAVVVDDPQYKKDTERSKREFLKSGLSVVSASWQEWLDKYRPTMATSKGCVHSQAGLAGAREHAVASAASAARE